MFGCSFSFRCWTVNYFAKRINSQVWGTFPGDGSSPPRSRNHKFWRLCYRVGRRFPCGWKGSWWHAQWRWAYGCNCASNFNFGTVLKMKTNLLTQYIKVTVQIKSVCLHSFHWSYQQFEVYPPSLLNLTVFPYSATEHLRHDTPLWDEREDNVLQFTVCRGILTRDTCQNLNLRFAYWISSNMFLLSFSAKRNILYS